MTPEIEKKILLILRILRDSGLPMGARLIARRMADHGIPLSERMVRYHLCLTDERGLTELAGQRDGRAITERGIEEIDSARVRDKLDCARARNRARNSHNNRRVAAAVHNRRHSRARELHAHNLAAAAQQVAARDCHQRAHLALARRQRRHRAGYRENPDCGGCLS